MNGDAVCHSRPVTLLHSNTSKASVHGEMMIKVTQEGRRPSRCSPQNDAQSQEDGRKTNTTSTKTPDSEFTERETSHGLRSPRRSDEQPSPPPLHYAQTCLRSSAELPLPLSNGLPHAPFLANNAGGARPGHRRRGVRHNGKGKKSALRRGECKNVLNRKVTDYFPIRRSSRRSKAELKCEQKKHIDALIADGIEEGLEVQHVEGKGRAVFATRRFQKGEYVVEYHGDLLQITDAKKREAEYALNPATGCYMYYFQYLCKTYCVDATKETGRMGRLINHSKNGNCQTRIHDVHGVPHLILVASRDIAAGEELLYDYGDRSRASVAAHPWLKY